MARKTIWVATIASYEDLGDPMLMAGETELDLAVKLVELGIELIEDMGEDMRGSDETAYGRFISWRDQQTPWSEETVDSIEAEFGNWISATGDQKLSVQEVVLVA